MLRKFIFLFCIWTMSTVHCQPNKTVSGPVFILEPKSPVEFMNTAGKTLDCSAHGVPDPEISWYTSSLDGQEYKATDVASIRRLYKNGSMVFMSFRSDQYIGNVHSAIYRCSASNVHGRIVSSPVSVRAGTKQQLQAKVYNEYVIRGNTAVLKCHIPTFQKRNLIVAGWIREDNYIIRRTEPRGSRYYVTSKGNLHIRNVKISDQLISYWCQVRNIITNQSVLSETSGKVYVTESRGSVQPRITDINHEVSVEKGASIELACAAQGYPPPTYTWINEETNVEKTSSFGSLIISDTQKPRKTRYTCDVKNTIGSDKDSTVLTVREHLQVYITPQQQVINTGQGIILTCKIKGYPIDNVEWRFNGKRIAADGRVRVLHGIPNVLAFEEAKREDKGMYQCFVSNQWETVQGTAQLLLGRLKPSFIRIFKSKTVQPDQTLSLTCSAMGIPRVSIQWLINGRNATKMIDEKKLNVTEVEDDENVVSKLFINNIRVIYSGSYTCKAYNEIGEVSHTNEIRVYGRPLVHPLKNLTIAAGKDVVIMCYVSGYPIAKISWKRVRKSVYMPIGSKAYENGTLLIENINRADSGTYECSATNENGQEATSSTVIKVIAKPEVSPLPAPGQLSEGSHFTTICNVIYGDEPFIVKWLKDGEVLNAADGIELTKTKMYVVLQIRKLHGRHNGNYTCLAQNIAGKAEKTVEIRVAYSPTWIQRPKSMPTKVSENLKIPCQARGYPKPNIRWFKVQGSGFVEIGKEKILKKGKSYRRFEVAKNGSLIIYNILRRDRGTYRCMASNNVLPDLIDEVDVRVGRPPTFMEEIFVIVATVGEDIKLTCSVRGDKPINIEWRFGKTKLTTDDSRSITVTKNTLSTTSIMIIYNVTQSNQGLYSCSALNIFGKSNFTTSVTVKDPYATTEASYPLQLIMAERNFIYGRKLSFNMTEASNPDRKNIPMLAMSSTDEKSKYDRKGLTNSVLRTFANSDGANSAAVRSDKPNGNFSGYSPVLVFIIPAAVVIILLASITIIVILVMSAKKSNARGNNDSKRQQVTHSVVTGIEIGECTLTKDHADKADATKRPPSQVKKSACSSNAECAGNVYTNYQIPDYYAGLKLNSSLNMKSSPSSSINAI
ncbi:Uncharacterised protein g3434 [Pycnogonum litorale]